MLKHIKTVWRRGKPYYYFNTGQKRNGKPVYIRLPDINADNFGNAYSAAKASRTKRANTPVMVKVPELVRMFRNSPDYTAHSRSTQETYGIYLKRFADLCAGAPAHDIKRGDIFRMLDKMAHTPAAADMLLLAVRQLYRWAVAREHVTADPTEGIKPFDAGGEYEPWPDDLVELALRDVRVALPVALLYFTAQRIGDVCKMRWNDIRAGTLCVTQQKTGKELEIPVHSRLAAILAETPKKGLTILTGPNGKPPRVQTVRKHLQAFGNAHGVKLVPHGLRKNAVNALLEAGCSTGQVGSISGQSLGLVEWYAKKRNNAKMGRAAILKWEKGG